MPPTPPPKRPPHRPHANAMTNPAMVRAAQLLDQGHPDQARVILQEEIRKDPSSVQLNQLMRHTMSRLGQFEAALFYAQRAIKAKPDDPTLLNMLGNSYAETERYDDAIATFRKAIELDPRQPLNHAALAMVYTRQMLYVDALHAADTARISAPHNAAAVRCAAAALAQLGCADEVPALLQDAVKHIPDIQLMSLLCSSMLYAPSATPGAITAAHLTFGRVLASQMPGQTSPPIADPAPDRPLRIGLLGADFRGHAMRFFTQTLLEHIDQGQFQIYVYMHAPEDAESARMKGIPGIRWANTAHFHPVGLAARIRQDRIDVLIDTSSHTALPVLMAMHLRPAPVQAAWLAYPCTTGVDAIDYRIVDSMTDPEGYEKQGCEKLIRIDPYAMAYRAPDDLPPVADGPSTKSGAITFGSFSAAPKINDHVVRLWARIVRETPGSKLVLKNFALRHQQNRDALLRRFELAGLAPARIELLEGTKTTAEHLALYGRMDIALDTFPYPSITTACEALVMGVPMISMSGPSSVRRSSIPVLNAVGLDDLVCATDDEYVGAALKLAADAPRRTALRHELRPRLLRSPLGDGAAWAARFSGALRSMWKQRVAPGTH